MSFLEDMTYRQWAHRSDQQGGADGIAIPSEISFHGCTRRGGGVGDKHGLLVASSFDDVGRPPDLGGGLLSQNLTAHAVIIVHLPFQLLPASRLGLDV